MYKPVDKFIMPKPKGGRGKIAPYKTRQVRVPEPMINQVDELIETYQSYVVSGGDAANPPDFFKTNLKTNLKPVDKFLEIEEIINTLREALKLKANAGGAIKEQIKKVLEIMQSS